MAQGLQRIYIDGKLAASQAATGGINPAMRYALAIGARCSSSTAANFDSYFQGGAIFDVRIFNYALSMSDVNLLMVAPQQLTLTLSRTGSSLVLSWSGGTLLEAVNLAGPWTTNVNNSPYTFTPAGP
jgi:hypothetical protein